MLLSENSGFCLKARDSVSCPMTHKSRNMHELKVRLGAQEALLVEDAGAVMVQVVSLLIPVVRQREKKEVRERERERERDRATSTLLSNESRAPFPNL